MRQTCEPGCFDEKSHITSWINGKNIATRTTNCNVVQIGWTPIAEQLNYQSNNEFANFNFGPHRKLDYLFYEIKGVDFADDTIYETEPAIQVNITSFGENDHLRRQYEEQ